MWLNYCGYDSDGYDKNGLLGNGHYINGYRYSPKKEDAIESPSANLSDLAFRIEGPNLQGDCKVEL